MEWDLIACIYLPFFFFFLPAFFIVVDSSFVPPLIYAILGSSNNLAVGTVAAGSLLLASIVSAQVSPTDNPQLYAQLFYTAAFFTGILQTALGFLRREF